MTIPARYTLTDAHWVIGFLTKSLKRIESNKGWGDYYACGCITAPDKLLACDCAPRLRQIARDALAGLESFEPTEEVHWVTLRERAIAAETRVKELEVEVKDLKDDLRDWTNDEIETDRALHAAIARRDELAKALQLYGNHISRHAFHPEDGCTDACGVCRVLQGGKVE